MKSAIIHDNPLRVELVEVPIPEPSENEVLIRIIAASSNPKDWKYSISGGDDIAGYIHKVGSNVIEFRPGDRVAALHVMLAPHGAYAEYGIAPAHTTFHIPKHTSFEEASTIPMAAATAAVTLFQQLHLPQPWNPLPDGKRFPFLVYGGSSAVGAFALKFLKLANIHPIITVAGAGVDYIKSLGIADHVIDYRKGNVVAEIKAALNGEKLYYAYDAVCLDGSSGLVSEVLENPGGKIAVVKLIGDSPDVPGEIELIRSYVGSVHTGHWPITVPPTGVEDIDFGHVIFRYISRLLVEGRFSGHPQTVIEGGLGGVEKGLNLLKEGKASATKYVYRIAE